MNAAEVIIFGAKGGGSPITAPRREHSRKPDEAYELIERMYCREVGTLINKRRDQ
jgi:N6-adenosine-specific RNA methylase IME4